MLRFLIIACLLAAPSLAYPEGAPRNSCKNGLVPGHHAHPQNTTAPYSFSGDDTVKSGDKIKLTLSGDDFLGFILQAQDDRQKPVGTFKVLEETKSQLLKCSAEGDTLTHVHLHKKPINSVEFEWLAPEDYKGTVKFAATVVKDYATFWVGKINKEVSVV